MSRYSIWSIFTRKLPTWWSSHHQLSYMAHNHVSNFWRKLTRGTISKFTQNWKILNWHSYNRFGTLDNFSKLLLAQLRFSLIHVPLKPFHQPFSKNLNHTLILENEFLNLSISSRVEITDVVTT